MSDVHKHEWFTPDGFTFECCRKCGIVRRRDDKNKPCPGVVKVTLRDKPLAHPAIEKLARELAPVSWDHLGDHNDTTAFAEARRRSLETARAAYRLVAEDLVDEQGYEIQQAGIAAFQDPKNRHGDILGEVMRAMIDARLKEVLGDG